MENNFRMASKRSWSTIRRLGGRERCTINTVYDGDGALLTSTRYVVSRWGEYFEDHTALRGSVKSLTEGMSRISDENKRMKESIIDFQARSMRDNLVFSGIPEQADEDPELTIKNFIQTHLKLPANAVKNITFHRVHRLGGKRPDSR